MTEQKKQDYLAWISEIVQRGRAANELSQVFARGALSTVASGLGFAVLLGRLTAQEAADIRDKAREGISEIGKPPHGPANS